MAKILVYGTLRRGNRASKFLDDLVYQGDVRLPGYDMINLGGFPGIVPNPKNKEGIVGEVFDGVDDHLLEHLDYYEGYNSKQPENSHYIRKEVDVGGDAVYVYQYNKPTDREWILPIPTGDWNDR